MKVKLETPLDESPELAKHGTPFALLLLKLLGRLRIAEKAENSTARNGAMQSEYSFGAQQCLSSAVPSSAPAQAPLVQNKVSRRLHPVLARVSERPTRPTRPPLVGILPLSLQSASPGD